MSQQSNAASENSRVEFGLDSDLEQGKIENSDQDSTIDVRKGRPEIEDIVNDCIAKTRLSSPKQRVGVGACGPAKLLEATQAAVINPAHDHGPLVTLHTEVRFPLIAHRSMAKILNRRLSGDHETYHVK